MSKVSSSGALLAIAGLELFRHEYNELRRRQDVRSPKTRRTRTVRQIWDSKNQRIVTLTTYTETITD